MRSVPIMGPATLTPGCAAAGPIRMGSSPGDHLTGTATPVVEGTVGTKRTCLSSAAGTQTALAMALVTLPLRCVSATLAFTERRARSGCVRQAWPGSMKPAHQRWATQPSWSAQTAESATGPSASACATQVSQAQTATVLTASMMPMETDAQEKGSAYPCGDWPKLRSQVRVSVGRARLSTVILAPRIGPHGTETWCMAVTVTFPQTRRLMPGPQL
mmetsp:Transcript_58423/g.79656  ORF Transcript_58423/g.79656 Transcript_58423/m.79656 type:complete len:216 (+) Transcript_58423:504-1151(+)